MLNAIAIGAGILIAALLGFAATKPDTFRVQCTKSVQAPPEKILLLINDYRRWGAWRSRIHPRIIRSRSSWIS